MVKHIKPPTIEKFSPNTKLKPAVRRVPSDIAVLMDLMSITPVCYEDEEGQVWLKLNNDKTLKYVRIEAESLGMDEDAWRHVLGLVMDYGNGEIK